jgi:AAA family ATP:ADP antiporter
MIWLLRKLTGLDDEEAVAAAWAFSFFFCVLASYYTVQPLRDEIGLLIGKDETPKLFVVSMLVMLVANPIYAALLNRSGRIALVKSVYRFFILNIAAFFALFKYFEHTGQMVSHGRAQSVGGVALVFSTVFFVWVGVFSVVATSLFWALMADLYTGEQSKRVFGFIGAGGTLGQLAGSLLTRFLVHAFPQFSPTNLLLVDIVLLEIGVQLMLTLTRRYQEPTRQPGEDRPGPLAGATDVLKSPYLLAICLYLFLYSFSSSFLYFQKQQIVAVSVADRSQRVGYFSDVNIGVGLLTLLIQLFVTGSVLSTIGLSAGLSLVPVVGLIGFSALAVRPQLGTVFWMEVARRTANFAISQPSREVLFTAVSRREKYLAKNFMDTVVYRLGDTGAAFLFGIFVAVGVAPMVISLSAIGASLAFLLTAVGLGQTHTRRIARQNGPPGAS